MAQDEENPPVGFEHAPDFDPEHDEVQDGYWTYADGSRHYGSGDPQLAQQLLSKGAGLAGSPTGDATDQAFLASNSAPEATEPAGIGSTEDAFQQAKDASQRRAPDAPAPPPVPAAQPAAVPPPPVPPPPPMLGAGQSGSRLPVKSLKDTASEKNEQSAQSSESSSRTGSAQDKAEFQQQQGDIANAYGAQEKAQDTGAAAVVAAQNQRRDALAQMGADKEAVTAGAQGSAEIRKQQVIKKYQEVDSRKTDMNGLWKDKGALGTTLGLLGVALRSLTATKFNGPNTALQAIQEQKRQNIQAQMEDRNSELRGLERELGSIEAAAPMLEARMNDALSKRIDAMTVNEKSATVLANAAQMKTQLETEKASKMAESAKTYAGTLAQQQSMQSGQTASQGRETAVDRENPKGAGTKPMTPKELAETDKAWEEQGVPAEQRAQLWKKNGYAPPTGPTAAELKREGKDSEGEKRTDEQGKIAGMQAASANYARALGGVQDKDGHWTRGGEPQSDAEIKAARTALRVALHLSGYDEKSAETATPEAGGFGDKVLNWAPLPFVRRFANTTDPEDQFAQLNAAEQALTPRLSPTDRTVTNERGLVKGKKVGNMNAQATR